MNMNYIIFNRLELVKIHLLQITDSEETTPLAMTNSTSQPETNWEASGFCFRKKVYDRDQDIIVLCAHEWDISCILDFIFFNYV